MRAGWAAWGRMTRPGEHVRRHPAGVCPSFLTDYSCCVHGVALVVAPSCQPTAAAALPTGHAAGACAAAARGGSLVRPDQWPPHKVTVQGRPARREMGTWNEQNTRARRAFSREKCTALLWVPPTPSAPLLFFFLLLACTRRLLPGGCTWSPGAFSLGAALLVQGSASSTGRRQSRSSLACADCGEHLL